MIKRASARKALKTDATDQMKWLQYNLPSRCFYRRPTVWQDIEQWRLCTFWAWTMNADFSLCLLMNSCVKSLTSTASTPPGLKRMGTVGSSRFRGNSCGSGWYVNPVPLILSKSKCTLSISNQTLTTRERSGTWGLRQLMYSELTFTQGAFF